MPSVSFHIDDALAQKLDELVAKSESANKSDFLRDMLDQEVQRSEGKAPSTKEKVREVTRRRPTRVDLSDRIKGAIADAVELKAFTQALGIDITGKEGKQQGWYPPWMYPYMPQQQQPQPQQSQTLSTKEMMDQITLVKMIDTMGEKAKDPETTRLLSEIKDKIVEQMNRPRQPEKDPSQQLMDRIVILKSLGMTDEAKGLQTQLIELMQTQMQKADQDSQAMGGQIQQLQQAMHQQDIVRLQTEMEKIKNRPTELDKIRELSELAQKDPAVEAYMRKRLGIEKGGFNVKDLGEAFRSMNINVGEFVDALTGFMRGKAPIQPKKVPAPPTVQQPQAPEEEGLPPQMAPPEALKQLRIEEGPTETVKVEGLGERRIPKQPAPTEEVKIVGERPETKPSPPKTKKAPKPKKEKKE